MADPCQAIRDEIAQLRDAITADQEEPHSIDPREPGTGPARKAALMAEIKDLLGQIHAKEDELSICVGPTPEIEIEPPVTCTFTGTATVTTSDSRFPGPFFPSVSASLTFSGLAHSRVQVMMMLMPFGPFTVFSVCAVTISVAPMGTIAGTFNRDGDPVTPAGSMDIPAVFGATSLVSGPPFCQFVLGETRCYLARSLRAGPPT